MAPLRGRAARLLATLMLLACQRADGVAFTPGNVIVLIPQGWSRDQGYANSLAVSLAEYSPAGAAAQTFTDARSCTVSGAVPSGFTLMPEGKLVSSFDGSRVSWSCYACAAGAPNVSAVRRAWGLHPVACPDVPPSSLAVHERGLSPCGHLH